METVLLIAAMELTDSEMGLSAYLCTVRSWKFEHSKVSIATSLHYLEGGNVLRKKSLAT